MVISGYRLPLKAFFKAFFCSEPVSPFSVPSPAFRSIGTRNGVDICAGGTGLRVSMALGPCEQATLFCCRANFCGVSMSIGWKQGRGLCAMVPIATLF